MGTRFIDTVKVVLKAGDGGRGCVAFRREKYVPRGGPAGGDGGDGGNVIIRVDNDVNTLLDFRYRPYMKAGDGSAGMGDKRSGKRGSDLVLKVPPGTVVKDADTDEIIADLISEGDEALVARGGRGGRGNAHFATPSNRAPRRYEMGTSGQERRIELELKSIADVGLVGFPNAGKSTLLSAISAATPEIADYPFTTLTPHLGVVYYENDTFVVADIPGLIHGASKGRGLGREFLRHVERTSVLLYVLDAKSSRGDPVQDFLDVQLEVMSYSETMKEKESMIALNKIDLLSDAQVFSIKERLEGVSRCPVIPVSALCRQGLDELLSRLKTCLGKSRNKTK